MERAGKRRVWRFLTNHTGLKTSEGKFVPQRTQNKACGSLDEPNIDDDKNELTRRSHLVNGKQYPESRTMPGTRE